MIQEIDKIDRCSINFPLYIENSNIDTNNNNSTYFM